MIICETATTAEAYQKNTVQKVTTGKKFVTVYFYKDKDKTTFRRFHGVIIDGIRMLPTVAQSKLDDEADNIKTMKDDLIVCQNEINEIKKQLDKNGCMIGRLFGKCGKKKD